MLLYNAYRTFYPFPLKEDLMKKYLVITLLVALVMA